MSAIRQSVRSNSKGSVLYVMVNVMVNVNIRHLVWFKT